MKALLFGSLEERLHALVEMVADPLGPPQLYSAPGDGRVREWRLDLQAICSHLIPELIQLPNFVDSLEPYLGERYRLPNAFYYGFELLARQGDLKAVAALARIGFPSFRYAPEKILALAAEDNPPDWVIRALATDWAEIAERQEQVCEIWRRHPLDNKWAHLGVRVSSLGREADVERLREWLTLQDPKDCVWILTNILSMQPHPCWVTAFQLLLPTVVKSWVVADVWITQAGHFCETQFSDPEHLRAIIPTIESFLEQTSGQGLYPRPSRVNKLLARIKAVVGVNL